MGRVSKRGSSPAAAGEKKHFKAGIYARLSSDQDKKSESVEVQVLIAEKYIEDLNRKGAAQIDIADRYIDIGKTGSNFNRDAFQRLMQDIRLGGIDCVVVKDLSRFGRNYLEAGNYIEKIFPFLGVRFIAVADGIDTGNRGDDTVQMSTAVTMEIKNLVNDMYARDFSVKAKQHLRLRRQEGAYVGGPAPYGYKAGREKNIRKLLPDENTAGIVARIFSLYIETGSYAAVADDLNRQRVNPPCVYRKTGEVFFTPGLGEFKGWDKGAVKRILRSETYTGKLVQGRTSITARDEKNRVQKPRQDWVIRENTHEPIVDSALFQEAAQVQERLHEKAKSHRHKTEGCPIGENLFDSVLYCGVCGKKMTRSSCVKICADSQKARIEGYFCADSGRAKAERCPTPNRIAKTQLADILLALLRMEFLVNLGKTKAYTEIAREQLRNARAKIDTKMRNVQRDIAAANNAEQTSYMQYRAGVICQGAYNESKVRQQGRLRDLDRQRAALEADREKLDAISGKHLAAVRALLRLKSGGELTKELVESLIRRIEVYPGKRIEVWFCYSNELLEGVLKNG